MTTLTDGLRSQNGLPGIQPLAVRVRTAQCAVNPLLEAARPALSVLAAIPQLIDFGAAARWHERLENELRFFTRVCGELRLPPGHVQAASYSLCAGLDEAIARASPEGGGFDWETNSLAVALGHDRQGGDRVFELIGEALRAPQENLDLLELFQVILDFGFRGKYRFERGGDAHLQRVRGRVYSAVATGGQDPRAFDLPMQMPVVGPVAPSLRVRDPWLRLGPTPAPAQRKGLKTCLALSLALLLGAGSYASVNRVIQPPPAHAVIPVPPVDTLAQQLNEQLRDEVAAGNVELSLDPTRNALTLRFNGMYASGDVTLAPWGASIIASVGRLLETAVPGAMVRVVGYTDSAPVTGTPHRSNQILSEERARQVEQILIAAGVPKQNVGVAGNSDVAPLADNSTTQGRMRNRRVEVTVIGPASQT
ncbi:type IVB secretion system protein IcmH/DotU [Bordetella sp. LUAb4]|uniref:type IVB secretion system protein IcmH/DotU n=1 Tax=Bordetella sp. LUAb4 TaxID=2843195 RepID=UPI001E535F7F|nr:type IVB secretion system protein IcmH/DotU [Bordetella sp. LUAb4]